MTGRDRPRSKAYHFRQPIKKEDMCEGTLLAAACAFESGHLTLVSGAGEGEVVSKEVGEEERGAQG